MAAESHAAAVNGPVPDSTQGVPLAGGSCSSLPNRLDCRSVHRFRLRSYEDAPDLPWLRYLLKCWRAYQGGQAAQRQLFR